MFSKDFYELRAKQAADEINLKITDKSEQSLLLVGIKKQEKKTVLLKTDKKQVMLKI